VKFAGIRTLKGEKKSRYYAYLKEYGGGRSVKEANWLFGGVDRRLSYTTSWYPITPQVMSGFSSNDSCYKDTAL
jgi:hypothetical protein